MGRKRSFCGRRIGPISTPRNHLFGSSAVYVGLIEYYVRTHMRRPGSEHLLFSVNQVARAESRQLKAVPMRDRIGGASLYAVSAKNASVVIDVVNLRVALRPAHAIFSRVIGGFDVDAIRGTIRRTQKTCDALFQPIFVPLEHMRATVTRLYARTAQRPFAVGIIFDRCRLEHLRKRNAHPLGDGRNVFEYRHLFLSIPDNEQTLRRPRHRRILPRR
jgi:hypothetical protein